MNLGSNIKKYRTINNMKQQELADMLEVSRVLVSLWEKGTREPQNKELKKMSEIFNIPTDILLSDTPTFSNTETYEVNSEQISRPIIGVVKGRL